MSTVPAPTDSRSRVLLAIETAPDALNVEQVCAATELHPNTVRNHLEVLIAAGAIVREPDETSGRGRPRWLYRAANSVASPFQFLAEALSEQLASTDEPGLAETAASHWAHAIPDLQLAATPDEAVSEAVDALRRLGFRAESNAIGDQIAVTSCPYANVVDDNPVICDIHTALVSQLLSQTGQPVSVESMVVWARPEMCVARLRRPDLVPSRTIAVNERGRVSDAEEKSA